MSVLERLHLCVIWLVSLPGLLRLWRKGRRDGRGIRVNYGYKIISSPGETTFGGLVKLQDLHAAFPNCLNQPNILYLVSSALPHFSVRMAKMAKRAGAKLIINQNGVAYPGWHGDGWEAANKPMRDLLHLADFVIYQSRFCRQSADMFLGKRADLRHEILYNPVDTTFFCPAVETASPLGDTIVLLLAGSHWSPYRVITALETLQKVRTVDERVRLRIAGRFCWHDDEDMAKNEVLDHAKSLGIEPFVTFSGTYTQQQAPSLMRQCSLLLHTKYNDPCPRLVVEAMACGLPVVYSATGGVEELVGSKAGAGVKGPRDWDNDHPPDAVELARAVQQVLADYDEYARAARARAVDRFDVATWLRRHEEIFSEVLQ